MKIAIGCDEAAYRLKAEIMKHLDEKGVDIRISEQTRGKQYCIRTSRSEQQKRWRGGV